MTLAARRLRDWVLTTPMPFTAEADLQLALAARLEAEAQLGHPIAGYTREVSLDQHNRIDFVVNVESIRVGVEVKIGGSLSSVLRQLTRYADFPEIDELLLITTRSRHHHVWKTVAGKPLVLCSLIGDAL